MSAKAEDAALLTQGKDNNAGRRKIDRKDEQVFNLIDYIMLLAAAGQSGTCVFGLHTLQ